jgi:hypothetical protein
MHRWESLSHVRPGGDGKSAPRYVVEVDCLQLVPYSEFGWSRENGLSAFAAFAERFAVAEI